MASFPAGEESDASSDEWDISCLDDNKSSCFKDGDDGAQHAEDKVSVLKRAISEGDVGTIGQLLDDGMDVDTPLGCGWTPLMCAVSVSDYHMAELLLDGGATANFSKDQMTMLMASCRASATEDRIARCVELLLSRNADPNMLDRSKTSCLMLASREGYSKVINLLVSHGAKVNIQDRHGYTALSMAVQHGREEAVLKLLQLGADKTIKTSAGKSPADLAESCRHKQISRILSSSSHISTVPALSSVEDTLSKVFSNNSECSSRESVTRLGDLELLLHGLDLSYLTDIMTENDITWSYLLTMEKEDLEKIGIRDPVDQQKVLSAVQQMHLDTVDLDTIRQMGAAASGSEELQNFLLSVSQQCSYLTESVQDVIRRFPRHASQLVFSPDPDREAQRTCSQLLLLTSDLQKEVTCLRNLLRQMDQAGDSCQPPQLGSDSRWTTRVLTGVGLSALGASFLLLLCRAASGNTS
ncbi:ankyrin repeat, SAM and basic leucine zipper domain-containing protein 1 [Embiotoca jacksoni]|uniref:ankyrin repeat, SAM and basic leucine zipper domain-containing protein 1 n=1 Tax=Embiotoca jacksoni TaxID=100190 RepID=UPI0037041A9B